MKPSVLIAAGCSWVAGRAIDCDPSATEFNFSHVEDPESVKQHSFAGILQRRLDLDELHFIARNGSNNEEQCLNLVSFIEDNYKNYSTIFVLWGLTSIYRWQMYSASTGQSEACMVGKKFKVDALTKEVKYHFSHHWDKDTELKKLKNNVVLVNGYLKNLGIEHIFFNAFQSYKISDVPEFYQGTEENNDLLSLLCVQNNVKISDSSVPWLNLLKPQDKQFNNTSVKELQKEHWLDQATAHPTIKAHKLIADELYNYIIKEKTNERI